jgi:hypothetical protein
MGIGDWGLGIGDWGLGPIPNPQSPIPNPQSPIPKEYINIKLNLLYNKKILENLIKNKINLLLINVEILYKKRNFQQKIIISFFSCSSANSNRFN